LPFDLHLHRQKEEHSNERLPQNLDVGSIRDHQQDRIAQGVKSGQLTAGETARLEGKEARLNHEIRDDREDHNGHLTKAEKAQVNRQQNRLSRQIYRDKHNGRTQ
jgi:hypothetical protein